MCHAEDPIGGYEDAEEEVLVEEPVMKKYLDVYLGQQEDGNGAEPEDE